MSKVKFHLSEAGVREIYRKAAKKIDEADKAFRATHEGYPMEVVRADAAQALPVELTPGGLNEYAQAVSDGTPFVFHLR